MGRVSICPKTGVKKGAWSKEEDTLLSNYINRYGIWNWREIPKYAGLSRCGKSCRLRWLNYLRPNIKRGNYTREEEELIIKLHKRLGNRWSTIAESLPGRTDNEIKNHWHTHLSKVAKQYREDAKQELVKCNSVGNLVIPSNVTPQLMESKDSGESDLRFWWDGCIEDSEIDLSYSGSSDLQSSSNSTDMSSSVCSSEMIIEYQATNDKSEIPFLNFGGDLWNEPALVRSSCSQEEASTSVLAEPSYQLSPFGEAIYPCDIYETFGMDMFVNNSKGISGLSVLLFWKLD